MMGRAVGTQEHQRDDKQAREPKTHTSSWSFLFV